VHEAERQSLPNTDRLSVLTASILLAYAVLPFIQLPDRVLSLSMFGALFNYTINFSTILTIISAALAAAGTDWLLRDHPRLAGQRTYQHLLIPAFTAWVIGAPLSASQVGLQWWGVFGFGSLLLVLVLVSEYIAVDPYDTRHGPASVALIAVSYALFLILIITLVGAGMRLYLMLPALVLAAFLITLRSLYLRLNGRWSVGWSAAVALVVGQVITALHYLPVSPLRFGLMVVGLAYALASLAGSVEERRAGRSLWLEPLLMISVLWGLAIFLRI
jgi:hypothetical protein